MALAEAWRGRENTSPSFLPMKYLVLFSPRCQSETLGIWTRHQQKLPGEALFQGPESVNRMVLWEGEFGHGIEWPV